MDPVPADRRSGCFCVGEWLVRPSLNQLSRGQTTVHLRPKVMDVLVLLAAHPGQVVSKEEIVNAVWAKKYLGDAVLSRAVFELRRSFGDDTLQPTFVETVAKRGYRLLAPVGPPPPSQAASGGPAPRTGRAMRWGVAVAGAAAVAAALGWFFLGRGAPRSPDSSVRAQTRIVVLPFANLGPPEDDYFAAGITDEITGRLTSVPGIAVISRDSADHYAGSGKTDREIGRELGVDYVLDGTIRWERSGGRGSHVRIAPRLIRVGDDTQVWATAYDRVIEDIFSTQSEIARNVIAEVGIALKGPARDEIEHRPTDNIEAYQAFLRGMYHSASAYRPEQSLRLGLQMFERAVQLDPGFAVAWAEIARVRALLYLNGFDRTEGSRSEATTAIGRAVSLAPNSPRVRFNLGLYHYWFQRDFQRALDEFALAKQARGDWADIRVTEAYVLRRKGRWEEALKSLEMAAKLDPSGWSVARELGVTCLYLHRYEEAERHLKRAIALAPDEEEVYGFLAETYWGWNGDLRRARATLQAMPRAGGAWPTSWWFWQQAYEGKYKAALEETLAGPVDTIGGGATWLTKDLLLGRAYAFLGRQSEAKAAFERERARVERLLRESPDDAALHGALGLCLASLGRRDDAIREGRRAIQLVPVSEDAVTGQGSLLTLAEIYALLGESAMACEQLEELLAIPSSVSAATLGLDPRWQALRGHECFRALLARHGAPAGPAP